MTNTALEPIASYSHPKMALKFAVIVGFCALLWAFAPLMQDYQGNRYPTGFGKLLYVISLFGFSIFSLSVTGSVLYAFIGSPPVFISDGKLHYFKWLPRSVDLGTLRKASCGSRVSALGHKIILSLKDGANVSFDSSVIAEPATTVVGRINGALTDQPT